MSREADPETPLTIEDLAQARQAWVWVSTQADVTLLRAYVEHLRPQLERRGLRHESLAWAKRDLSAARTLGDDTEELFSLLNLGEAYDQVGLPQEAIVSYVEALPLATGGVNYRARGVILGRLGSTYQTIGDYERAKEYFSQALAHAQELQHGVSETVWASILGHTQTRVGDASQAIELYEASLARARALGDHKREASAWRDLADTHTLVGGLAEAQHAFEKALSVSCAIQDPAGEAEALVGLATVAVHSGEEQVQHTYHERMLAALPRITSVREQVQFLGGAGLRYGDVQAWRSALDLHERQLVLARQIADLREEGLALAYKGQALHALGQLAEAEQAWEAAVVLLQTAGDTHIEARTLLGLARLYVGWNRRDDARRYYERAREMAGTLGDERLLRELDSDGAQHVSALVPAKTEAMVSDALHKDLDPKPLRVRLPLGKGKDVDLIKLSVESSAPDTPNL